MNVFHSCDGTAIFIRSPHENICTIALITIHYLYTMWYLIRIQYSYMGKQSLVLEPGTS